MTRPSPRFRLRAPGAPGAMGAAVAAVFAFALATACGSFDYGDEKPTEVAVDAENPNWNADILPLMALKCMNCHASPKPRHAPRGTPAIDLANEGVFKSAKVLPRIWARTFTTPDTPMPPEFATPLTTAERLALKKYLEDNGIDTTIAPTPKPDGVDDGDGGAGALSAAFRDNCAGCHGGEGQGISGPNLKATRLSESAFLATARAGKAPSMPATDASKYKDAEVRADYAILKARK